MRKILLCALLFASCSKQTVKPESVSNCGTIIAVSSRDISDPYKMIYQIENTYTVLYKDGTTGKIIKINSALIVGDEYCK